MAAKLILTIALVICVNSELILCGTGQECNCTSATAGETCTLNCNQTDICKGKTLNCRDGDPCHINCQSPSACSDNTIINADTATDVTVTCEGDDACKTDINIQCGTGYCQLECHSNDSCNDFGTINTNRSSSFQCIGSCPLSEIPPSFSTSPSFFQRSLLHFNASIPPTLSPSFGVPGNMLADEYIANPLFYILAIFSALLLCGCCLLCLWIYSKERKQKTAESKLNVSKSLKPNLNINNLNESSHSLTHSNESDQELIHKYNKYSNTGTETVGSSRTKTSMDNSSELYNEGPLPTYVKINTTDINAHKRLMKQSSKSHPPIRPRPRLTRVHAASDGSHTTQVLPMPPPRVRRSTVGILSNYSSEMQTPVPQTPIDVYNSAYIEDVKADTEPYRQRSHYASLPTIPSLPALTPENSMSLSMSNTEMNLNNSNHQTLPNTNSQSIQFTVSMVSCMVLEDLDRKMEHDSDDSRSIEYQSHRKRTFESYDLGNTSLQHLHSNSNAVVNENAECMFGGNSSTIRLHGITEASETSLQNEEESLDQNCSEIEQQSVKIHISNEASPISTKL